MKRLFLILTAVLITVSVMAVETQDSVKDETQTSIARRDSLFQRMEKRLERIELELSLMQRYKLYPTENIYNFLLLDTKLGKIDQVQWNPDTKKEFTTKINDENLTFGYGYNSGSFELYPTQNMYQFILLDKLTGRTWHVQWGLNEKERWIRRIY